MTSVEIRIDEILKTYTKSQVATDATGQRLTSMEISFQYQPNAIGVKEAKQKLLAATEALVEEVIGPDRKNGVYNGLRQEQRKRLAKALGRDK